jgi:hypothetical protein
MKMLCKYRNKRGGTVLLLCIALQSLSVAVFSQESTVPPELICYADDKIPKVRGTSSESANLWIFR